MTTHPLNIHRRTAWIALVATLLLAFTLTAFGQQRIKDIANLEGQGGIPMVGYGIVVGLEGTGDSPRSLFTNQALGNMMERFGISISSDRVRTRNVAGVMVTGTLNNFAKPGQRLDVTVSSLGDARSLQGGTLLLTPLVATDQTVYGVAQGPLSIGGFHIEQGAVSIRKNASCVGRIPNGFLVEQSPGKTLEDMENIQFVLNDPDYTTARRMADAINTAFGREVASALDPVSVVVEKLEDYPGGTMAQISDLELLLVTQDVEARVVVNERTGTVVIGADVGISNVAISHGTLSISIVNTPVISQPGAFSQGQTVSRNATQIEVEEQGTGVVVMEEAANVGDVAAALNSLGVTPRDIIAIFQALQQAGALRGELVII
ncbi:flagellar basal body P-ring protein FlgI [bacterium]|nr:flagellar basal body P-ring protein FlgI [bacterium]